ncbi:hypothetical protein MIR68_008322 [Amoeboaphelidium protococcarum]|nr:hypothetical protein MIR68_008322 [Amoeboaphelidium protococcarum]
MSVSVPIKLLHECIGHIVTVELNSGEIYRGLLHDAEDSMNIQLVAAPPSSQSAQTPPKEPSIDGVLLTHRDGKKEIIEHAFIRGSNVRYIIAPDMLRASPIFDNIGPTGLSKGRQ